MDDIGVKPPREPTYLGDGVQASFDGYQIELRTLDGNNQTIYLELPVWNRLGEFAKRCWGPVESAPAHPRSNE